MVTMAAIVQMITLMITMITWWLGYHNHCFNFESFRLHYFINNLFESSIDEKISLSSIFKKIEVIFQFQKNWGRLPFSKILRSSSIFKKMRSSFIFLNIEVVFHISFSWVQIRLHTKNQLPKLSRTALIVKIPGVVWWWWWSDMRKVASVLEEPPQIYTL
jgi:hypothetical protein